MTIYPASLQAGAETAAASVPQDLHRVARKIVAAAAGLAVLVIGFMGFGIWRGHVDAIADGERDTANIARVIAAHAAQGVEAIDLNLKTTEQVFRKFPSGLPATPEQIEWLLSGRLRLHPNVQSLFILDRNGILTHTTSKNASFRGTSMATSDYYQWHLAHASTAVHVGVPTHGRTFQGRYIPVSRQLTAPDGQFDGVIVATLEPKFWQDFYASVNMGEHGLIAILLRDGTMLARGPRIESLIGASFAETPLFREYLPAADHGTYRMFSTSDGVPRIFSYTTVPGADLVVVSGVADEDVLAGWRHQSATDVAATGVFLAALAWMTWSLLGLLRRRQALIETLAREEARYRRLLEAANEGIWKVDAQRRTVLVNPKVCELLGYTEPELMAKSPFEFIIEEDRPLDLTMVEQRRPGAGVKYDLRYRRKDGSVLWTITSVTSIFDETGTYIGALGMLADITERARAERELQRNYKHLEALRALDQAILAAKSREEIAVIGLRHMSELLPYWGAAVTAFDFATGQVMVLDIARAPGSSYQPGALLTLEEYGSADLEILKGGCERIVFDVEDLPARPRLIQSLCEKGMRSYVRIPLIAEGELVGALNLGSERTGAYAPEQVALARTFADQLAIALRQSSLRRQVEGHADDLVRRVAERTAELEAANRELESFSYTVSHDLRAPLRHIAGFANMLLEDSQGIGDAKVGLLERIHRAAKRMDLLIDDLLALAKTGRATLRRERVDMRTLASEVIDELSPQLAGREVEWKIAELPSAYGDLALLRNVLQNLLGNAVKYTSQRAAAGIEVGAELAASGETVYFVRDNGAGFDMRYAGRLFHAFSRLHDAKEFEGTGIGLATVQRIIHRHGGRIWAQAAEGQGATFYFTLAAGREPVAADIAVDYAG